MLEKLTDNISESSSDIGSSDKSEPVEEEDSKDSTKQKVVFTDDQYGYTGRESFDNPPTKLSEETLKYFGYDYFVDQPDTFALLDSVPIPPDYIIGPNDNIKIILYGNKNKEHDLKVTRDGDIFIPEIGPLYVSGLTFDNLKSLVQETINSQMIGTQVSITLGSLRSINVFVLGAARKPGMYSISALSTLTNAIFKSGGIDISGSLRNIKLKRNGATISNFDFYDLLLNGDTSKDTRMMQGDVVFIEPIGKTSGIKGLVNRPAIYELNKNENLGHLLKYSGGLKPKANLKKAEITRINSSENSFDLVSIDLSLSDSNQIEVKNGDVISVYPVVDKMQNAVLISGHAQEPGFYPWNQGMMIRDIFKSPDDLLEMTDLNYVLIKRKDPSSKDYNFLQVDLEDLFNNDSSENNIELLDQDEILFLPSLLSPEIITTKLIEDKYIFDPETNQMVPENEWNSMTYLRKSLIENEDQESQPNLNFSENNSVNNAEDNKYYEYSIYDYCTIPEDVARNVLLANSDNNVKKMDLAMDITKICRQQQLDPFIELIRRDNSTNKLNLISIFGSVHFPGTYPFTKNMTLLHSIQAAGGPKNGTYNAEIELSSINNIGKQFSTVNKLSSMKDSENVFLDKMDTITLKQMSTELKSVLITGEVFFPGNYPISENQTLTELIKRAGGLTEFASPAAANFQREELKELEEKRFKEAQKELNRKAILLSQTASTGTQSIESDALAQISMLTSEDAIETESFGRLIIDLDSIINSRSDDIVLEDSDIIHIPKMSQTVAVIGEVNVSSSHIYGSSLSVTDYINLSGGFTTFADINNIYLIRSNGSVISSDELSLGFFRAKSSSIQPGDTVVVPLETQSFSALKATTEISQIIYQMAIAAAAVNSF